MARTFNNSNYNKNDLINACADLFGYTEEDLKELTMIEIWERLSDEQQAEVIEFDK